MRIAIDATHMFGQQRWGVGYYTWHLVHGLLALKPPHDFLLYNTSLRELAEPLAFDGATARITRVPKVFVRWRARLDRLDLYQGLTDWYTASGRRGSVLVVVDLAQECYPAWIKRPARCRTIARRTGELLRRATKVIAISSFVGRELQERFGLPPDRLAVIHPGVDHAVFVPPHPQEDHGEVRGRYRLTPGPYLVTVGSINTRKNILTLLQAYATLRPRVPLVIAGSPDWGADAVLSYAAQAGFGEAVRFIGYVPRADLVALYQGALAFVFPSWYEGFGLPALEAMACGTPVVASTGGALPEVVGDSGLLVEPGDVEGWRDALARIIEDDRLRQALQAGGFARARQFTWEQTARKTLAVYDALDG